MEYADGEYVMFVDADDCVFSDYVEVYVKEAEEKNADLVIGGLVVKENNTEIKKMPRTGVYSKTEFVSLLCNEGKDIYGYACNKLFRRSLIEEFSILFNEEMNSQEDLDFALSFIRNITRVCCIDYCGYVYYYEPSVRLPQFESVLGNQIKLFQIAEDTGADTAVLVARFQRMLYSTLYHAKSSAHIRKISELKGIDNLLCDVPNQRKEVNLTVKWFARRQYQLIYRYFACRHRFRKILCAMHMVRPVE